MKKISTIINFVLLMLLVWLVILFVTNSTLLTTNNYFFEIVNHVAKVMVYPQLIFQKTNPPARTYLSLSYILIFLLYLNLFAFYFLKSRFDGNNYFRISTSHELSSFLWVTVYSKIKPAIYFHPDTVAYEQLSVQKSLTRQFIQALLKNEKAKLYLLAIFTLGFIVTPYFCADLLYAKPNRLVAFWNSCLVMVYLQFKFIFEVFFIGVNLIYGNNLNKGAIGGKHCNGD